MLVPSWKSIVLRPLEVLSPRTAADSWETPWCLRLDPGGVVVEDPDAKRFGVS